MSDDIRVYTPGIVGGLGPQASIYFQQVLYDMTPASIDQDHVPYLYISNPAIPDRNEYLLRHGLDYAPALFSTLQKLEWAGATELFIICNTAYEAVSRIQSELIIPVFNTIDRTIECVAANGTTNTMLLATTSTLETKLFHQSAEQLGVSLTQPEIKEQQQLMDVIYAVKEKRTAEAVTQLQTLLKNWQSTGVKTFVLGCTELSFLYQEITPDDLLLVDPLQVTAQYIIDQAMRSGLD